MSIQAMTNFSLFCLGLAFLILCGSLIFLNRACKRAASVQTQADELLRRNKEVSKVLDARSKALDTRSKALDAAEQAERSKFLRETTSMPLGDLEVLKNVVPLRGARG